MGETILLSVLSTPWLSTKGQHSGDTDYSYGAPTSPIFTGYGVPLADPLDSSDTDEYIIGPDNELMDIIASAGDNNAMTEDMNLKMLMASVPGVPGDDYPILEDVISAGDTGFTCQGKIVGGEYWLYLPGEIIRR